MAGPKSLDQLLQESRKQKNLQDRAQAILGSKSRTPSLTGTSARGVTRGSGIAKRPSPPRRTSSTPAAAARARPPRGFPPRSNRPRETQPDEYYDAPQPAPQVPAPKTTASSFSVRGAAKSEPFIVTASNFAPGTTAADIEAVMADVGGEIDQCVLVASNPVTAEMTFVNRQGAEAVIEMFDGKKADGRTLHVNWKSSTTSRQRSPEPVGFFVDTQPAAVDAADAMEVDEHTREREEQNRLREERRGAGPRVPANEPQRDRGGPSGGYPSGPRADRNGYDDRGRYGNGDRYGGRGGDQYGYGGGRRDYGGGRGGRGRY